MKVVIWILYIMIYVKGTMELCKLSYNGRYVYFPFRAQDKCPNEPRCSIWCNTWNRDSLLNPLHLQPLTYTETVYNNLTISNVNLTVLSDIWHGEKAYDSRGFNHTLNIISLILDDTGLQEISAGAFSFFTKSSEVHLSKNHLTSITSGVFDPLIDLVLLDLSHNELSFIDDSAFEHNKKLSFLYLNYNKLISVPQTQMSLIVLDISNNSPQDFDTWSLKSEGLVQTLNLSSLNINESMVDFTSNLELRQLILHHNAFTALDGNIFCNRSQIFKLDICYNKIDSLKGIFFRNLINLELLYLRHNELSKIDAGIFTQNGKLITLDLSENMIVTLEPSALETLINLEFLHLRNNKLSKIEQRVFAQNNKLITLDLSSNMIVTIEPFAFENLSKLEVLNLNNNRIKILPDILYNQNGLNQLTLIDNPFEVLPLYETWNFPQLQDLNLTGLRLDFQATHFSLLSEIFKNIDLSNNTVTRIDSKMFANLSHLALLDVSHNLLFSIDKKAFRDLCNLKTLKLQGNKLKSISSHLLDKNHQLKHINLSHNIFFNFLPGAFDSCKDLTILDLSFNKITTITKFNFHRQINLETLYLNNNNLFSLEGTEYLRNLRSISIENNDWNCHYLFDLLEQFDSSGISIVSLYFSDHSREHVRQIACHQKKSNTSANVEKHIHIKPNNDLKNMLSQMSKKPEHTSHLGQLAVPLNEGVNSASNQTVSLDLEKDKDERNEIKTFLYVFIVFGLCILSISVLNLYYKIKQVK